MQTDPRFVTDEEFMAGFSCSACDLAWPHHHGFVSGPSGATAPAVIYHSKDPGAEVRDPDTGEVIFRATKGRLKVVGGSEAQG